MNVITVREGLEDFNRFCSSVDVRAVIAAADESGTAQGYEKELYALAILRALRNGDFGEDGHFNQTAVSAIWECGHLNGFNRDSFNAVFEEFFVCW
jgi:hypothetical protein